MFYAIVLSNSNSNIDTTLKIINLIIIIIIIIIITYHVVLPPSRMGSRVKSDNAHTIIQLTPISPYNGCMCLDISSCAHFTDYPNYIMKRHPTYLGVTSHRAQEGAPKEPRNQAKMAAESQSSTYAPWRSLYSFSTFAHCLAASAVIPLLPMATFTQCIQHNLGLPHSRPPLTSAINFLLAIRYAQIFSICPNHLSTL